MADNKRNNQRRTLKSTLKSGTAIKAPEHTSPYDDEDHDAQLSETTATCRKQTRQVLDDSQKAAAIASSAQQRACFAIMLDREAREKIAGNSIPSLQAMLESNEAHNDYVRKLMYILTGLYSPPAVKQAAYNAADDKAANDWRALRKIVKAQLYVMIGLKSHGVHSNAFDKKLGVFTVPIKALLRSTDEPFAETAKLDVVKVDGTKLYIAYLNEKKERIYGQVSALSIRLTSLYVPVTADGNKRKAPRGKQEQAPSQPVLDNETLQKAIDQRPFNSVCLYVSRRWDEANKTGKPDITWFTPSEWKAALNVAAGIMKLAEDARATGKKPRPVGKGDAAAKPAAKAKGKAKASDATPAADTPNTSTDTTAA